MAERKKNKITVIVRSGGLSAKHPFYVQALVVMHLKQLRLLCCLNKKSFGVPVKSKPA